MIHKSIQWWKKSDITSNQERNQSKSKRTGYAVLGTSPLPTEYFCDEELETDQRWLEFSASCGTNQHRKLMSLERSSSKSEESEDQVQQGTNETNRRQSSTVQGITKQRQHCEPANYRRTYRAKKRKLRYGLKLDDCVFSRCWSTQFKNAEDVKIRIMTLIVF